MAFSTLLLQSNATLVFALCGITIALSLGTRFESRRTRLIAWTLAGATVLWCAEYAIQLAPGIVRNAKSVGYVISALVSAGFGLAGWWLLRPREERRPEARRLKATVFVIAGHPVTLGVTYLLFALLLGVSLAFGDGAYLGPAQDAWRPIGRVIQWLAWPFVNWENLLTGQITHRVRPDEVRDFAYAVTSAIGMCLLGLGLLRTLVRARRDPVSIVCASSVLAYASLQLFQVLPDTTSVGYIATRVLATLFKVTFIVSLCALWVAESAQARLEQVGVGELLARHLGLLDQLHDHIGSAASALARSAESGSRRLGPKATTEVRDKLADLAVHSRSLSKQVRELLDEGPTIFDVNMCPQGIATAITQRLFLLQTNVKRDGGRVRVAIRPKPEPFPRLSRELESGFYGVAIEALNNIEKHTQARNVIVRLNWSPSGVEMVIEDDHKGPGIKREDGKIHYGMARMNQLATALGCRLDVGPLDTNHGTRVRMVTLGAVPERGGGA